MKDYQLLDSGNCRKWERFGNFVLNRPCPQAIWKPSSDIKADAIFNREEGSKWTFNRKLPASWEIEICGIEMKISLTDFGHLGVFPEHSTLWDWMREQITPSMKVLNLFAYSGGATLAAAQAGASVCHLDAAKGMVQWARENAELNQMSGAPIRWIVDDAIKFLRREVKRGARYEGILLDPPTFGRGAKGETFKIERDIQELISLCRDLLSEKARFFILSCHTPGLTPLVLSHLLGQYFTNPIESFEMLLESENALSLPSGSVARISL